MAFLSEAEVEQALLAQLQTLGYGIAREEDIGPDGRRPERESYSEVVLQKRLQAAVARLNPGLPDEARQDGAAGVAVGAACVAGRKRPPTGWRPAGFAWARRQLPRISWQFKPRANTRCGDASKAADCVRILPCDLEKCESRSLCLKSSFTKVSKPVLKSGWKKNPCG